MSDDDSPADAQRTRRQVANARNSLLLIYGLGALGIALAIAWVASQLPKGQMPTMFVAGPDAGSAPGHR